MFDDIIKNKADEHEAPVPPDAWDNIVKKKKKRRFAFWWWGSALLLLLALSTGGYFLLNNNNETAIAKTEEAGNTKTQGNTNETQVPANEIKKENKAEPTLPPANKDIAVTEKENNAGANDLTGKQKTITVTSKAKTNITTTNAVAEANEIKVAGRNKQIKKIKGKLKTQQTNGEAEELITVNNNEKTNNNESIIPVEEKEENSVTKDKETIAAKPVDVKTVPVEEKKTTAIEAKKPDNKKTNPVIAKKAVRKHWFFEAGAIPLIAASHYNQNSSFYRNHVVNNTVSSYKANLVNASIEPAIAFSLLFRREVSKKIAVGTGLQYMLLKENMSIEGKETNTTYTFVDRLVNGRLVADTVATVTENERAISAVNSYQLFSIPIYVQYSIIQKPKWSLDAVGGLYFNISGNYKNEINRNAAAPLNAAPGTTNKSNTGMDIFAGMRIGKKLSRRLDLFAMPSMRLSLAKYNVKNSLLDKNINQAGVGFGLCYKIN